MTVALRTAVAADTAFVERIFFETQRWLIEALFGWRGDDVERARLYESRDFRGIMIVQADGTDVGWIDVKRRTDHIELDSIFLTANAQGHGIGSRLIADLIREAAAAGLPLRLSTAKINPANELYRRLGFRVVAEDAWKRYFEYPPPADAR